MKLRGIEVPDQLSVLGVDNIYPAGQMVPELTTYSLDANIMIAECFALMDMATDKGESLHKKVILQPTLITRDTLKRINERKVL